MTRSLLPGGRSFKPLESSVPVQPQASSLPRVLVPEGLAHGAYYAGKLGAASAVARWHGKKRVFVLAEITLGRHLVKTVAHVAEAVAGERFAPLSQTAANDTCEVTDFAFETCA